LCVSYSNYSGGTDTGVAIYNKYMSSSMDHANVGIAAHLGGMATGMHVLYVSLFLLSFISHRQHCFIPVKVSM